MLEHKSDTRYRCFYIPNGITSSMKYSILLAKNLTGEIVGAPPCGRPKNPPTQLYFDGRKSNRRPYGKWLNEHEYFDLYCFCTYKRV